MSASFLGGYWYRERLLQAQNFSLLQEAYRLLMERGLIDPPPAPALQYGMIRGMLQAYGDPYSAFFEPAVHELTTNQLEGKYGGIGIEINRDQSGDWILFPFPDSPAQQAGVRDGDRLLAIDDIPVNQDTSLETLQAAERGPVGSRLTITISHTAGAAPLKLRISRQEITVPTVTWHLDPTQPLAGIIRVNLMAATTQDEILRAVENLQARAATHFILDLRDNPGGYLTAGIDVARLFLKAGVLMQQQYRGHELESYTVDRPGSLSEIPLAVLINHGSASASEIVAGALQAAGRAPLIGAPTYGKDTIQLVFELSDNSSLHLTAARWWVPGLTTPIGGVGLQPNILVDPQIDAAGIDMVLQAALKYFFNPSP